MRFVPEDRALRMPTHPSNYALTFEQDIDNFGGDLSEVSEIFEEWLAS